MKTVKLKKSVLRETINNNMNAHKQAFELAFEGYRSECMKLLAENLENLKTGKKIQVTIYERAPEDHSDDYDTILHMIDLSVDEIIELTHQEFRQYVEDNWAWRQEWNASNAKYLSK